MEVTVNINEDDVIALNEHLNRTLPGIRRRLIIVWLMVPTALGVVGVAHALQAGDISGGFGFFVAAVVLLLVLPLLQRWGYRRGIRRLLRSGRNLDMLGQQKVAINSREIGRYNEYGHSATYWTAVERIDVGARHAFVFVASIKAVIIPKRDFNDEAEFDYFVETARTHHEDAAAEATS